MLLASIPSPTQGVWFVGPIPLRGYAVCIIAGIILAVWIGNKRWVARGGEPGAVLDISMWAVPFGILGGRIYHVITSPGPYFGENGNLLDAFKIWEGGLGIWGAIALGGVGAWIGCRRKGVPLTAFADAVAPGIAVAQAVGRLGNWFNNELYGAALDAPWALTVYRWDAGLGQAIRDSTGEPLVLGTFHPTFLYELLWNLGVAALVIWADRRFNLSRGRAFALYVAAYCAGRVWIEALRIDPAETVLGLRLNVWTSILVFIGAVAWFVTHRGSREDLTPTRAGGDEDKDDQDDQDDQDDKDDKDDDADAELNDGEPEQADDDSGTAQDHVVDAEPSKRKPLRRSTRSKQADL
ncbi:MAG: prolipoprotein diacylglyceryl transferase [Actinomycetota bacterium]|nr:prolipoprotein diacylglyceryl transferase [Actinomycetota bacterium]